MGDLALRDTAQSLSSGRAERGPGGAVPQGEVMRDPKDFLILRASPPGPRSARPEDKLSERLEGWEIRIQPNAIVLPLCEKGLEGPPHGGAKESAASNADVFGKGLGPITTSCETASAGSGVLAHSIRVPTI